MDVRLLQLRVVILLARSRSRLVLDCDEDANKSYKQKKKIEDILLFPASFPFIAESPLVAKEEGSLEQGRSVCGWSQKAKWCQI